MSFWSGLVSGVAKGISNNHSNRGGSDSRQASLTDKKIQKVAYANPSLGMIRVEKIDVYVNAPIVDASKSNSNNNVVSGNSNGSGNTRKSEASENVSIKTEEKNANVKR